MMSKTSVLVLVGVVSLLATTATAWERQNDVRDFQQSSFGVSDLPGARPTGGQGPISGPTTYRPTAVAGPGTISGAMGAIPLPGAGAGYAPLAPMQISAGGVASPVKLGPPPSPLVELERREAQRLSQLPQGPITTLVPEVRWESQDPMRKGEAAFREGDFAQALTYFQQAATLSSDRPESVLSLVHAYVATGEYQQAADRLLELLARHPMLPMLEINPRSFIDDPAPFDQEVQALEQSVTANPQPELSVLLSYLKLQYGSFAGARQLAQSVAGAPQVAEPLRLAAEAIEKAAVQRGQERLATAPQMGPVQDLPAAGIRLALPQGFESQRLFDANQVLMAVRGAAGTSEPQNLTLSIYPIDPSAALGSALDHLVDRMRQDPAMRNLSLVMQENLDLKGSAADGRVYEATYMGQPVVVARLAWVREELRLMYVLGMGVLASQRDQLLPTFGAVARSMEQIPFVRPIDLPVPDGQRVEDALKGVVFVQPAGWAIRSTETGFEMGPTDFLQGGAISPRVRVVSVRLDQPSTPQELVAQSIEKAAQGGRQSQIVQQSQSTLSGHEAFEVVAGGSDAAGTQSMQAARVTVINESKGQRACALVVDCAGCSADQAKKLLDELASKLELVVE